MAAIPPARPWLLVTTGPRRDAFGAPIPPGTPIARQMWDGLTRWQPPEGLRAELDDGRPVWQPRPPPPPPSPRMSPAAWLQRLPQPVLLAIAGAAQADAGLLLALLLLAAAGEVDLDAPSAALLAVLDRAVAATAGRDHALTADVAAAMRAA